MVAHVLSERDGRLGTVCVYQASDPDAIRRHAQAAAATGRLAAGGWLLILMGYLTMVALVSFHYTLREAGPILILAPVLAVVGMTLVTVSHLIPIAMAYELAPAYAGGSATDQASLVVVSDTLAATSLVINAAGNALGWGVVVPLYAWAILSTRALPRWIGWLGFVVAVFKSPSCVEQRDSRTT